MSDNRPMVSVIVITYNHEPYIKQTLDSILMQITDFKYEILIGDDASIDKTQDILQEYAEKHANITLFLNKENQGANQNAFRLIKNAKGRYLANCDGDDYWTNPHKLQLQVDFLEKNKEYVGCTHDFTIVNEKDDPIKKQHLNWVKKKHTFRLEDFKGIYMPGQPSTFLRRNLVHAGIVDLNDVIKIHPMIGDRTAMLLFLLHGDFGYIDQKMSCYRRTIRPASITNTIYNRSVGSIETDYKITLELEKLARSYGKHIDCTEFKKKLFAKAFVLYLKHRTDDFLRILNEIYHSAPKKYEYLSYIPIWLIKRVFEVFK